jgi:hypothetical protein
MFIANLLPYLPNTLLYLVMTFGQYRQWQGAQVFLRQRDPFFTDPPLTV